MIRSHHARAVAAALTCTLAAFPTLAFAEIRNFHFSLLDRVVKVGPDVVISVRLADDRTGRAAPDAVIFATRLDMAPDGMATMATKIETLPGSGDGIYRFKAKIPMAGTWRRSLAAKVQGEEGTVDDKLVVKASE